MKNKAVDERLCSLLNLEQGASEDEVFEAVKSLFDDRNDANDTAGDLTHAMVAVEEDLGIPQNDSTSPDLILQAIEALRSELQGWRHDYFQLVIALALDPEETEVDAVIEEIGELQALRGRYIEGGRKFREAAGLDPHAPEDRLVAEVEAMRDERIALRRMLELAPSVQAVAVYDVVDRLKRRATDQELAARELRSTLSRIATELGLDGTGAVQEILDVIRKLKPSQREAAMSNAAWLASAWEVLCQHLRLPPGASLQDALAVIDESIDVRDRVVSQFDFSGVSEFDQLGNVVEHRILAQRAAQTEVSQRMAAQADRIDDLSSLVGLVELALGLDSGASSELVVATARSCRRDSEELADLRDVNELLTERASVVSDLVTALTSANARLAVSIGESSR